MLHVGVTPSFSMLHVGVTLKNWEWPGDTLKNWEWPGVTLKNWEWPGDEVNASSLSVIVVLILSLDVASFPAPPSFSMFH